MKHSALCQRAAREGDAVLIDFANKNGMTQTINPFTPPQLNARAAERARRLAAPRAPIQLVAELRIALSALHPVDEWSELGQPVEIAFSAGGEIGYIRTVVPLLRRVLSYADVSLSSSETDAELSAFLLENVLVEGLSQLETLLGAEINFLRLGEVGPHEGLADLSFSVLHEPSGMRFPGTVYAGAPLLAAIARHWEEQPFSGAEPQNLRFRLSSRAAYIDLTFCALRELSIGDAMLFDRIAVAGGAAIVFEERLHALARFNEDGLLILNEGFESGTRHLLGDFVMTQDDEQQPRGAVSEAQIDDLPVRLIFEIGRAELTLEEVRALSVGTPLPLERASSSVVDIIANGRRIGAGEMVMIGDQLGVRVTRLVGHA